MTTHHTIITGDSRSMPELRDESVHLVVTSPPYWQLKDYGEKRQIGFHDSYETYIRDLNLVWRECERVLHKGCRLCINIGDQFARAVYYGRYKVIPIRTEITRFCEGLGMDHMGTIIWQKVTTTNTTGGATIMGSFPYPRNGILKIDYEFILLFKKLGKPPEVSKETKERSRLTTAEWNTYFAGHWNFSGEKQGRHLAMFPEELPRRLIRMFSFPGETVLDPFLGSGTTSLAAKNLGRNSLGFEINPRYRVIIREKLGIRKNDGEASCEFITRKKTGGRAPRIKPAPSLVSGGSRQVRRKSGRGAGTYGSKIAEGDTPGGKDLPRVTEVVRPDLLRLSNGLAVRLIGVLEDPRQKEAALLYLRAKALGRKVLLKFDDDVQDTDGEVGCYVYLRNKTFLNAHLIRTGFVRVDTTGNFRLRTKFEMLLPRRRP